MSCYHWIVRAIPQTGWVLLKHGRYVAQFRETLNSAHTSMLKQYIVDASFIWCTNWYYRKSRNPPKTLIFLIECPSTLGVFLGILWSPQIFHDSMFLNKQLGLKYCIISSLHRCTWYWDVEPSFHQIRVMKVIDRGEYSASQERQVSTLPSSR